jgi:hypothetical protein
MYAKESEKWTHWVVEDIRHMLISSRVDQGTPTSFSELLPFCTPLKASTDGSALN